MPRLTTDRAYRAALEGAGFSRHAVAATLSAAAFDVYRLPAEGRWFLEARLEARLEPRRGGGAGHVDIGLTLDTGGGLLVGPIHRALSAPALASALPHIVESLKALAAAAESLRCPNCKSWAVMEEGKDGAYLACGGATKTRKPFENAVRRCRRDLIMAALIIHQESKSPW